MQKLISIIVPIYNEEKNIPLFYNTLLKTINNLKNYNFEVIFVNDGSSDNSDKEIEKLTLKDERIKFIEFSRNFGKEIATSAGINNAKGDGAIMIDADLQHPIELIPEFIKKWEKGGEMIIGVRKKNKGEGIIKRTGSFFFYKIMNLIGETKLIPRATDYRLIDRKIINEFNKFTEHNRITRGLLNWLGFKRDFVYFNAYERVNGKASYDPIKLLKLSTTTFVSHSLVPLKLAGYLGIFIFLTSGTLGLFIFLEKYILEDPFGFNFSGPAILAVILLFLIGIVLICLGLIALYIGNIMSEVMNRPMYVIRKENINKLEVETIIEEKIADTIKIKYAR